MMSSAYVLCLLLAVIAAEEMINSSIMVDELDQLNNQPLTDTTYSSNGVNDILFEPSTRGRYSRQAEVNSAWPNALIPIAFSTNYPAKQRESVLVGMARWEKYTCVRFQKNDITSKDRVEVIDGGSCQSNLGRWGGKQTLVLGPGCNGVATSAHELGHVLGLQHTQTRSDRDSYITINKGNIMTGMFDLNFKIESSAQSLGVSYDLTSIMHYDPYAMAVNKNVATIVPKAALSEYAKSMGNIEPAFYDYLLVNRMYKCDLKCSNYKTQCANNGVKDVNNCNQCLCPLGWAGPTCNDNPSGSQLLSATSTWQPLQTTLGNASDQPMADYNFKHIIINAPAGRRVELKITYLWSGGCEYGGVQIAEKSDTRFTPPRACNSVMKPLYTSATSRLYLRVYNRFNQLRLDATFRAV